jgi:hypothetical protein
MPQGNDDFEAYRARKKTERLERKFRERRGGDPGGAAGRTRKSKPPIDDSRKWIY